MYPVFLCGYSAWQVNPEEEGIMILQNIWNYLPNKKSHTTVNFESLARAVSEHQILDQ